MTGPPADNESGSAAGMIARDRERILGSVALAVSAQIGAFAVGAVTMIVTARLLGADGYGRLSIFFMCLSFLSQVVVGWPDVGIVRFGREELARRGTVNETLAARLFLFVATLVVAGGLLIGLRGPLSAYLPLSRGPHALLFLYAALNGILYVFRGVFQTVSDFRFYALTTFSMRALKLPVILLAFLALALPVSPSNILLAHIASIAVVAFWTAMLLPWRDLLPVRVNWRVVRRMFAYSWPLMLAGVSALVVEWIDLAAIRHFLTFTDVGVYAISYQPVTVVALVCVTFVGAVQPLLVSLAVGQRHGTLTWYLDEALPQIAWAVGLGAVLSAGLAELIPLVLGEGFRASILPCQMLMPGIAFSVVAALQTALAQSVDRVRAAVGVSLTLAALNAVLDILLVPRMGILGAAVATTASFAASGALFFPLINSIVYLRGDAPRRRYGALVAFVPPILFAAIAVATESALVRTALADLGIGAGAARAVACIVLLAAAAVFARRTGVFRRTTLAKLDKVQMPASVRKGVALFYNLFGRG